MEAVDCDQIIHMSCRKIVGSKHSRGGARLHKNLLIIHLLKKARDTQRRVEEEYRLEEELEREEEEEMSRPPLEFTVRDEDGGKEALDAPLEFAAEAVEGEEENMAPPPALSQALDDALCRLTDRKRKPSHTAAPAANKKKTCKSAGERTVPALRLVCM